jgi:hypothetical protein
MLTRPLSRRADQPGHRHGHHQPRSAADRCQPRACSGGTLPLSRGKRLMEARRRRFLAAPCTLRCERAIPSECDTPHGALLRYQHAKVMLDNCPGLGRIARLPVCVILENS